MNPDKSLRGDKDILSHQTLFTVTEFDDNFGFNETTAFFTDAKDYNPSTDSDE